MNRLTLLLILSLPLIFCLSACENEKREEHFTKLFNSFKKKYNKTYKTFYDEKTKFENFKKNLEKYEMIKKEYPNTIFSKKSKINYYSDLSPSEIPWGLFRY